MWTYLKYSRVTKENGSFFQDVLDAKIYTVVIQTGTQAYQIFTNATANNPYYKLYTENILPTPGSEVQSTAEAKAKVLADETTMSFGSRYTYVGEKRIIGLTLEESYKAYHAIALQKNSEFRAIFDYYILKLQEVGIFHELAQKWIPQTTWETEPASDKIVLGYNNLLFPFFVLFAGTGCALILVGIEKLKITII